MGGWMIGIGFVWGIRTHGVIIGLGPKMLIIGGYDG